MVTAMLSAFSVLHFKTELASMIKPLSNTTSAPHAGFVAEGVTAMTGTSRIKELPRKNLTIPAVVVTLALILILSILEPDAPAVCNVPYVPVVPSLFVFAVAKTTVELFGVPTYCGAFAMLNNSY
jgi:hypothetical protein